MILSDVNCGDGALEISDCDAKMMVHTCNYNQSVWLNCNNVTGDLIHKLIMIMKVHKIFQ